MGMYLIDFWKIGIMAGVFSGAFFLHCVFIVTNALLHNRSSIFSFLGLLTTEILPSAFTLSLYKRVRTFRSSSKNSGNSSKETKSKPSIANTGAEKETQTTSIPNN